MENELQPRYVATSQNASVVLLRYQVADLEAKVARLEAVLGLDPLPTRPIIEGSPPREPER